MFTHVHSTITHSRQKMEINVQLTGEWTSKMCYIYTMECHSALNKKELLMHAKHG